MSKLTRTRSVLTLCDVAARLNDTGPHVFYGRDDADADEAGDFRGVLLDEGTRRDLGDPEQITVTIHPGDLLNPEPDEDVPEPTYGNASFEPVERADGRWDWRLVHENGNVLCGSDQGYENRAEAFEVGRRCLSGGYAVTSGWD